jgi:hypothetical protein
VGACFSNDDIEYLSTDLLPLLGFSVLAIPLALNNAPFSLIERPGDLGPRGKRNWNVWGIEGQAAHLSRINGNDSRDRSPFNDNHRTEATKLTQERSPSNSKGGKVRRYYPLLKSYPHRFGGGGVELPFTHAHPCCGENTPLTSVVR